MKKVFGYCRVSTLGQAFDGDSLEAQKEKIELYCKNKKLDLIKVFTEEGVSGAIEPLQRPQFSILMDGLDDNTGCGFVITKIDRLSRSTKDFLNFMDDIKDKYDFFCIDKDIDTATPQGQFAMVLFCALAQLERDLTSVRVKEVIVSKKAKGERTGTIPFGKRLIINTNLLEDDPEEIRTINMVKDYRKTYTIINGKTKYMTQQEICEKLIELGRKNKDGQVSWYPTQIRRILNDGVYIKNKGKNIRKIIKNI